nr:hypothetical protein Iba_chr01cCG11650 [Ipomoea batatas]
MASSSNAENGLGSANGIGQAGKCGIGQPGENLVSFLHPKGLAPPTGDPGKMGLPRGGTGNCGTTPGLKDGMHPQQNAGSTGFGKDQGKDATLIPGEASLDEDAPCPTEPSVQASEPVSGDSEITTERLFSISHTVGLSTATRRMKPRIQVGILSNCMQKRMGQHEFVQGIGSLAEYCQSSQSLHSDLPFSDISGSERPETSLPYLEVHFHSDLEPCLRCHLELTSLEENHSPGLPLSSILIGISVVILVEEYNSALSSVNYELLPKALIHQYQVTRGAMKKD